MDGIATQCGMISGNSAYRAAVLADSPLAYRNLNGPAETFNGSTRYQIGDLTTVDDIVSSGNFTLEGIVSTNTLFSDGTIIGRWTSGTFQILLWFDWGVTPNFRGTFWFSGLRGLTPETPTGYSVSNYTEYHVVYTYDGSNAKLYIDGIERASVAETAPPVDQNALFYVGDDGSGSRYLNGTLRGLAIYDTALSSSRILTHYNAAGI